LNQNRGSTNTTIVLTLLPMALVHTTYRKDSAMSNMTWYQMNRLDELTYEAKALLETTQDALGNECCSVSHDHASTVLRMVSERLDEIMNIHAEMWNEQREKKSSRLQDGGVNEDAEGAEDFDTKDLFSDEDTSDERDKEESGPIRINVEEVVEHEDGSVTLNIRIDS
jgi:hypothetical protein